MKRAVLVLLLTACGRRNAAPADTAFKPLTVGDSVPVVQVKMLDGSTEPVARGQVTLVNLWATWCESCREEMSDLAAIAADYGTRGLKVVAISEDDGDTARVARFIANEKVEVPVAMDVDGAAKLAYQAVALPESYLIGSDGRLLWRQQGGIHDDVSSARRAVAAALGDTAR